MWPGLCGPERERAVHKADRKIERETESRSRSLNVPRKTQEKEELTVEEYERAQCGKMRSLQRGDYPESSISYINSHSHVSSFPLSLSLSLFVLCESLVYRLFQVENTFCAPSSSSPCFFLLKIEKSEISIQSM